ncbi:hypothetical protein [Streptomyces sp. NPDC006971]|uniref:hypothetical protein n=1 Tax=Streptomyces sp. NPDC006971 TaxID=3154784 RepID=UPI0033E4009F
MTLSPCSARAHTLLIPVGRTRTGPSGQSGKRDQADESMVLFGEWREQVGSGDQPGPVARWPGAVTRGAYAA